jgi:hypothetical protein
MKVLRSVLIAFSFLFVVSSAHAQSAVQATIPFNFVAGNRVLPAGQYVLGSKSLTSGNLISIRDLDEPITSLALSNPCSVSKAPKTSKLVFHRIGNEYFLYQIWVEGETTGRQFPMSKLEVQMAKNEPQTEEVIVAALLMR